ncbi:MAG: endo alpha-1,4 polygalactosaminidase [Nocardioides sp.]
MRTTLVTRVAAALAAAATVLPLPVGTDVDYQLGGDRSVPDHVGIVVRDRDSPPAPRRYGVCYVNGFQTQASERGFWRRHPDLVLHRDGRPVRDEAWDEWLLDIRTPAKRQALARIVGRWTDGCARDGYDAVELDNLDSFTRSGGLLTRSEAIAYARLLVRRGHAAGLAVGQKNLSGFDGRRVGYDFAVAEECGRYRECAAYVRHYGRRVLAVEYRARDFRWTCARFGDRLPVVLRDRDLTPTGVRRWC